MAQDKKQASESSEEQREQKKQKKKEKKETENLQKTAKAKGTVSEEVDENSTGKMIEEQEEKEKQEERQKEQEEIKKMEEEERKEKEDKEKGEFEKEPKESEDSVKKDSSEEKGEQKTEGQKEIDETWEPITKLGREVKKGKIKNIDEILNKGRKIMEPEIVDYLMNIKSELISIGQSKGKFGGGKRRAWKQTQKVTEEGNIMTFSSMAIVGDEDGHIGLGVGRASETLPARDKALRQAKLNVIKIKRGCSSFDCLCSELHSILFKVEGKSGGSKVVLMPAPLGTGLAVADELKKVLELVGIKDVYSKTFGSTRTTFNLVKACINALKKTNR